MNKFELMINEARPHRDLYEEFVSSIDCPSSKTLISYKGNLGRYIRFLEEKGIVKPRASAPVSFKKCLRDKGCHGATIQLYVILIKRFYKWCERMEYYPNIAIDLKTEKVDVKFKRLALTIDEANKLLDFAEEKAKENIVSLRNYTIIYLILNIGLRTIECSRADIEDIKQEGQYFYLYVQGKGRTDKDESIRLEPSVLETVQEYIKARKTDSGPLFVNHGHRKNQDRMEAKTIGNMVKTYLKAVGINAIEYTAHSLRHTCATIAIQRGANMEEVKQLLRHKSVDTTSIYTHMINKMNNTSQTKVNEVLHRKAKKEQL